MSVSSSRLAAVVALSITFYLVPAPGFAAVPLNEKSARALSVSKGKSERVKPPRTHKRKVPRQLQPPEGILLKDLETGEVLFAENAGQAMAPASLTKIMSAVIILEEGNVEELVTVSPQAAAAHRIKLHLKPGQVLPLRGLLEAMLIRSANDACLAAVEHVGGTEDAFVEKMNSKAAALGLHHTHFRNACGFDTAEHYSTAEDLAALTEYAMAQETFAAIVREPAAVIRTADQRKTFIVRTTNRLMGTMEGVIGVKTGYTRGAGRCLITVVTREGRELLLVLLNARHRWGRAQALIEYGFHSSATAQVAASR